MTTELALPDAHDAGLVRRWYLPVNEVGARRADDPEYYVTYARFLGMGSSHTTQHSDHVRATTEHPATEFVERGRRCNACRWFEARIFRELVLPPELADVEDLTEVEDLSGVRPGSYLIHNAGMSVVPGEVPLFRYETTPSAYMVVEYMTTRRTTERGPEIFLAKPAAHALASAADFDERLREAYLNRAVT